MKLFRNIYLVGSGFSGFGLSSEYDCSIYLIDAGVKEGKHHLILIDSGSGQDTEMLLNNIKQDGFNPEDICIILLTHGHGDHSGGAKELNERTSAKVLALTPTDRFVSDGDISSLSIDGAIRAGMFSEGYHFTGCPTQRLEDGEIISYGNVSLQVIRTEGHCKGHAAYLMEENGKRILFSGDSVFAQGKISIQAIWDCDLKHYFNTCRKLDGLDIDMLFPSHGAFILQDGRTHIHKAVEEIDQLRVPPNE